MCVCVRGRRGCESDLESEFDELSEEKEAMVASSFYSQFDTRT